MNTDSIRAIAVTHPYREGQRFDEIVIDYGDNGIPEALRSAGADIRTYHMNARDPEEKKESEIAAAARGGAGIRFTIFDNHSVVPDGAMDNGGTNHMGTWPEVYSYLQLKRWLFDQRVKL